ncbi:hypothetical protein C8N46_106110 [Kordia periserrulae]|uniref:Uncharacterized protein n=1 Tax=Kordia periserrulae TaxID=701523 RepID=A0A2T6BWQ2_9FLAO|nr:hypothetical protein [Kordia periserrulae]PTX60466.1 hypothetical protein C8N46_106110 [Kordia periserrulae]
MFSNILNAIKNIVGSIIAFLFSLSEREPSETTWVVVSVIGICSAEYIYYISSDEGYFLTAIFVAIIGVFAAILIFNFLRAIPALFALVIISGIVMGTIIGIVAFIEFLSEIKIWSK